MRSTRAFPENKNGGAIGQTRARDKCARRRADAIIQRPIINIVRGRAHAIRSGMNAARRRQTGRRHVGGRPATHTPPTKRLLTNRNGRARGFNHPPPPPHAYTVTGALPSAAETLAFALRRLGPTRNPSDPAAAALFPADHANDRTRGTTIAVINNDNANLYAETYGSDGSATVSDDLYRRDLESFWPDLKSNNYITLSDVY